MFFCFLKTQNTKENKNSNKMEELGIYFRKKISPKF